MHTVWTNNQISMTKCMVFGLCVLSENGWEPVDNLDLDDLDTVIQLIDANPSFPWASELADIAKKATHPEYS